MLYLGPGGCCATRNLTSSREEPTPIKVQLVKVWAMGSWSKQC